MNPMNKQHILNEIKRTAVANGGMPLGRERFSKETGIKSHEWSGKYWARWSDALREAGFEPNALMTAYDENILIEKFIGLMRELNHWPVFAELRMKAHGNTGFPSHTTFARLGSRRQLAAKILEYCNSRSGYEDIIALCEPLAAEQIHELTEQPADNANSTTKTGYVYMVLLTIGRERRYKIGKAVIVDRRLSQFSLQLPEKETLVHTISTDDAYGIEAYWHRRFANKNTNGEWFDLSADDVRAFKRRKFM